MSDRLKKVFRLKNVLIVATISGILALFLSYFSPFVHPETASFLPFFGLGYWLIFLYNIALLIIWTVMRSKWALFILLCILLGGRLHFRNFAFGSDDKNELRTEISVMSYNVRLFDLYNSISSKNQETKNKIFSYIKEQDPDIVCFQEFYHQDAPTSFVTRDSLTKLMGLVDYHERYAHKMYGRQNFGIALFSKYPIIEKGFVNFPEQNGSFNYCIYADIVKEDTFRVYNIHLQSIRLQKDDYALFDADDEVVAQQSSNVFKLINKIRKAYPVRAKQAELIAQHTEHSPYPVILCGDFNDTPFSYCYNQFSTNFTDAFRNASFGLGTTYAGNIPAGRIDYIFHSPEIGSKEFNIQNEQLSDHYAIDCKLFLKE